MVYMFFSCFEQLGLRHRKFEVVCSKTKVGRGALTGLLLVNVNSYVLDRLFKNRKWGKKRCSEGWGQLDIRGSAVYEESRTCICLHQETKRQQQVITCLLCSPKWIQSVSLVMVEKVGSP